MNLCELCQNPRRVDKIMPQLAADMIILASVRHRQLISSEVNRRTAEYKKVKNQPHVCRGFISAGEILQPSITLSFRSSSNHCNGSHIRTSQNENGIEQGRENFSRIKSGNPGHGISKRGFVVG